MRDSEAAPAPTEVKKPIFFKRRGPPPNARKRVAPPPSDSDDSEYSSEDEQGQRVKRRKKAGVVASSQTAKQSTTDLQSSKFSADRSKALGTSNDATKQSNWYDEPSVSLDAKSLLGSTRSKTTSTDAKGTEGDGTYKGASNYSSFIQKNPNAPDRKFGPMKAATNIRTITVTDYAPDVCKDYKQTGYCGFGDSCKFLHAREDYKQGWAIDQEWEAKTGGKKQGGTIVASVNKSDIRGAKDDEEDEKEREELEKIPFACIICKKGYTQPIVTQCGHYFCEECALNRYRKRPDCAACGEGTNGVFNVARGLNKLLERKRAREERSREREEKEKEGDED